MLWHSKALLPSLTLFHEDADDNNWFENRRQWDTRIIPGSHPPPLAPHEDSAALHPPFDFLSMSLSCSSFLLHVFCFITVLTPSPSSLLNPLQTFFLHSLDLSHILMLPSEKKQKKYIMYRKVCDAWVFGCMLVCEEVPACIPLRLNRGRRMKGQKKSYCCYYYRPRHLHYVHCPQPLITTKGRGSWTTKTAGLAILSDWHFSITCLHLILKMSLIPALLGLYFSLIILFCLIFLFRTVSKPWDWGQFIWYWQTEFIGFVRRVKYLCTPACPPRKVPSESPWWWRKEGKCCITDFGHRIVKEVVMERWTTWLKEN